MALLAAQKTSSPSFGKPAFMIECGASDTALTANLEEEAQDVQDTLSEEQWEVQAIVGHRPCPNGSAEYNVRWKNWSSAHDTWQLAADLECAADTVLEYHKKSGGTAPQVIVDAAKLPKAQRKGLRDVSKLDKTGFELSKFLANHNGKGMKETQKGKDFKVWLQMQDDIEPWLKELALSLLPEVGNRYFVCHMNCKVHFCLIEVYRRFIADVAARKKKPGMNSLERSIDKALQDRPTTVQMRAGAVLADQIELPILWMSKKHRALELREMGFYSAVMERLEFWSTEEGAKQLMSLPGDLIKLRYPEERAPTLSDRAMKVVVAAADTDAEVRAMLRGCCERGRAKFGEHAMNSGHLVLTNGKYEAAVCTAAARKRAASMPAENDESEGNVGAYRCQGVQAKRLRVQGRSARRMGKKNKPVPAIKAGQLGDSAQVILMMRHVATEEDAVKKTQDEEDRAIGETSKRMHDLHAPGQTEKAIAKAATKAKNDARAIELAQDVDALCLSQVQVENLKGAKLKEMVDAWKKVPAQTFAGGRSWGGAQFRKGKKGGSGPEGRVTVADTRQDLFDTIVSFKEQRDDTSMA